MTASTAWARSAPWVIFFVVVGLLEAVLISSATWA
jgi:hypothetical protein